MTRVSLIATTLLALTILAAGQSDWEKTRSMAESQHEIVISLIKEGKFREAVEEAKNIFHLPFPEEKQVLLVDAAQEISDALLHHEQHKLAHEVVDEALLSVHSNTNQSSLYKMKAYLYKEMGMNDEARACFKKAVDLEDQKPQPERPDQGG